MIAAFFAWLFLLAAFVLFIGLTYEWLRRK